MKRLIIFTTHPIQYQAPWFRALAASGKVDIEVVFSYVPDAVEQGAGFGTAFNWDIPLLTGYPHTVLQARTWPSPVPTFARRWSRGIVAALDRYKPDVAMVLGWQELSLAQALLACRRRDIPIILRGESNALRQRPRLVSTLHTRYFSLCDVFLSIGQANARLYEQAGIARDRILRAGYFVDNARFASSAAEKRRGRDAIRRAWSIPAEACCFTFVGKLEPKKRVLDFLGALRIARDSGAPVHALIVGTGEQMTAAELLAREHALPVTFAGFLNQSRIVEAYVAADALVLPSDFGETWGLVVNEAMATGLPAIVSDRIGSAHDLVRDGDTGLVFPCGDTTALANAIARLAADRTLREAMGRRAQQVVSSEYTIEQAVAAAVKAYDQAIARRHARA